MSGPVETRSAQPGHNSRESVQGAGWSCRPAALLEELAAERKRSSFSWLSPKPLWQSRNDRLARLLVDPTNDKRAGWMRQMYPGDPAPQLVVDRQELDTPSFVILGDTGEGDASQYAVLPALRAFADDTDFAVICSDVIYPAGGINEYEEAFFRPYSQYPAPIYALPGNHDWYDDLTGFMFHFCGQETAPRVAASGGFFKRSLRGLLWRRAPRADPRRVAAMRALRPAPGQRATLPGPYCVIDTGPLQLVCIDTGITGRVDSDQLAWLKRVSAASAKPKLLLTGKPIYVDGEQKEGTEAVDAIVRAPEHNYIAAIGGDIHNYQRYLVDVEGGRTIAYLVSGGGGAFMHATHKILKVRLDGVDETRFRCYPLRGDSLSFYSKLYDAKLAGGRGKLFVPPDQAAAIMAKRLDITPTKPEARNVVIDPAALKAANRVFPLPGHAHGPLQAVFSEFFDWNDPPLFKQFLRVDATESRITITCHAATGCVGDENRAPEDRLVAEHADGAWTWQTPSP